MEIRSEYYNDISEEYVIKAENMRWGEPGELASACKVAINCYFAGVCYSGGEGSQDQLETHKERLVIPAQDPDDSSTFWVNCGNYADRAYPIPSPIATRVKYELSNQQVSWCLLTAVHSRCTQQEPVTTVRPCGETECIPTTYKRATIDLLHASCRVSYRTTFNLWKYKLASNRVQHRANASLPCNSERNKCCALAAFRFIFSLFIYLAAAGRENTSKFTLKTKALKLRERETKLETDKIYTLFVTRILVLSNPGQNTTDGRPIHCVIFLAAFGSLLQQTFCANFKSENHATRGQNLRRRIFNFLEHQSIKCPSKPEVIPGIKTSNNFPMNTSYNALLLSRRTCMGHITGDTSKCMHAWQRLNFYWRSRLKIPGACPTADTLSQIVDVVDRRQEARQINALDRDAQSNVTPHHIKLWRLRSINYYGQRADAMCFIDWPPQPRIGIASCERHTQNSFGIPLTVKYDKGQGVVKECTGLNAIRRWRVMHCCKVSWCLLTAVHSRCTQREPVTTAKSREAECIPTTHKRAARDPLHASCGVSCQATTELTPAYLATVHLTPLPVGVVQHKGVGNVRSTVTRVDTLQSVFARGRVHLTSLSEIESTAAERADMVLVYGRVNGNSVIYIYIEHPNTALVVPFNGGVVWTAVSYKWLLIPFSITPEKLMAGGILNLLQAFGGRFQFPLLQPARVLAVGLAAGILASTLDCQHCTEKCLNGTILHLEIHIFPGEGPRTPTPFIGEINATTAPCAQGNAERVQRSGGGWGMELAMSQLEAINKTGGWRGTVLRQSLFAARLPATDTTEIDHTPIPPPRPLLHTGAQSVICSLTHFYGIGRQANTGKKSFVERLARSPPTKANRVQYPAGSPDLRKWESCRTMPFVGGFSREFPVSHAPSFQRCSILISITLIGSQDLAGSYVLKRFLRKPRVLRQWLLAMGAITSEQDALVQIISTQTFEKMNSSPILRNFTEVGSRLYKEDILPPTSLFKKKKGGEGREEVLSSVVCINNRYPDGNAGMESIPEWEKERILPSNAPNISFQQCTNWRPQKKAPT
ncbi:hypothetical protein PR048_014851 [Dryococelus australis]|uniref:Uncharacterized protein n=1 Tax=Dryococelus australis TaxID=614101 RepID=A0ABQ9HFJ5_9NEOP|nr:hypothetical protein PR048_014851 [Dryococelus australis]